MLEAGRSSECAVSGYDTQAMDVIHSDLCLH